MPTRPVFRCQFCDATPDHGTQRSLQGQVTERMFGEYLDAFPGRWLVWNGGGPLGPRRYACRKHRGDLVAYLRYHYATVAAQVWKMPPYTQRWPDEKRPHMGGSMGIIKFGLRGGLLQDNRPSAPAAAPAPADDAGAAAAAPEPPPAPPSEEPAAPSPEGADAPRFPPVEPPADEALLFPPEESPADESLLFPPEEPPADESLLFPPEEMFPPGELFLPEDMTSTPPPPDMPPPEDDPWPPEFPPGGDQWPPDPDGPPAP